MAENKGILIIALLYSGLAWLCPARAAERRDLGLEFVLQAGSSPLALNAASMADGAGHRVSLSRLDFLVSGLAVQKQDGSWLESANWYGLVSAGMGKTRMLATGLPVESFKAIRFFVGVDPATNHADPNQWEAGHPLHPQTAALHWGWQGGYIFAALEGQWRKADGSTSGWSWHLATNAMLTKVELPADIDMARARSIQIHFDAAKLILAADLAKDGATTHSRPGDALAPKLKTALPSAFSAGPVLTDRFQDLTETQPEAVNPHGTPLPLAISSRLPKAKLPPDNPLTREGVALGRRLFNEPALSSNDAVTCATCHREEAAFSDPGKSVSTGVEGRQGKRNSMPLFNLAWHTEFFWDGRVKGLRDQVLHPIADPSEMNLPPEKAADKIAASPAYAPLFESAFGDSTVTKERIGLALEQYLLTLVSQESKFDRAARGEEKLTDEEQRGLELFVTEFDPARGLRGADCFHCHGGNLFTSGQFAANGLEKLYKDTGRQAVTGSAADAGKFRVPSLRNIALTAPYMHDGRFATLEQVIDHYDHGVQRSGSLDPNLAKHPAEGLGLSTDDRQALIAFLYTLTDESLIPAAPHQASRP